MQSTPTPLTPKSQTPHVPIRSCVACRRKRPQQEFWRLTKVKDCWQLQLGKRSGRGAYLCADSPACWKEKKLRRAFGMQATQIAEQLIATDALATKTTEQHQDTQQKSSFKGP